MSKILYTVILAFLFLPAFCQYGNMNVLDPGDMAVCSEKANEEGNVLFEGAGYMGTFVNVAKTSKVKLTVSAKSFGKPGEYPTMKLSCEKEEARFIVSAKDWTDYSVNFTLEPGIHFLKAENVPFPKLSKDRRSLLIERIYVSGNQCRLVNSADEKTVLSACGSEIRAKKISVSETKQMKYTPVRYDFGFGININDKSEDKEFIKECEKLYDPVICDRNEENISEEYTVGYVNGDDVFAKDVCDRLHILIKDKADTKELRIVYTERKTEDLFRIIHSLKLYDTELSLFDFLEEDREKTEKFVLLALAYCKNIVFNEKSPYFSLNCIDVLKPEPKGRQGKKYVTELFPGEYQVFGKNRKITAE